MNTKENMHRYVSKLRDFQSVTVLVVIEQTIVRRIEMFFVFHVRVNYEFMWCSIFFIPFSLFSSPSHIADNFRPYLTSFQGNAFTDYINAVFVDVSGWAFYVYAFSLIFYPSSFFHTPKTHVSLETLAFSGLHKTER